jgi:murein DD-endopeptidase MepM/ murein hydrolase activator NlpD
MLEISNVNHEIQPLAEISNFNGGEDYNLLCQPLNPLSGLSYNLGEIIESNVKKVDQAIDLMVANLGDFISSSNWENQLDIAFGEGCNQELKTLIEKASHGELGSVKIEIVDSLNNANGGYASSLNTIFLVNDFVVENTVETIATVLTEEWGHFLDDQTNDLDSEGDEGEIFAKLVFNEALSIEQLIFLQQEDDSASIIIDGVEVTIEQNVTIYEHGRYRGKSKTLTPGRYNNVGKNWNDIISSISIPRGWKVEVFEHDNFQGKSKTLYNGTSYVGDSLNDRVSSIIIYPQRMNPSTDVNGDGRADAIVSTDNFNNVTVRLSDGNKFLGNQKWTDIPFAGSLGTWIGSSRIDSTALTKDEYLTRLYRNSSSGYYGASAARFYEDSVSHGAIDSTDNQGDYKVYSLIGGEIKLIGKDQYGGNYIDVWNETLKRTFRYLHFSSFNPNLKRYSYISQGDWLGIEGSTGWSTGRHTHVESRLTNGTRENPLITLGMARARGLLV